MHKSNLVDYYLFTERSCCLNAKFFFSANPFSRIANRYRSERYIARILHEVLHPSAFRLRTTSRKHEIPEQLALFVVCFLHKFYSPFC